MFTKFPIKHIGKTFFNKNYTTGLDEKLGVGYQWLEIFITATFWILVSSKWKKKTPSILFQ